MPGYTVVFNELKTSEFSQLVVFSRIINVTYGSVRFGIPGLEQTHILHYSKLMPDVTVLEFIDNIAGLLCLMYDIDERKKTVRILFKKNIFEPGNVDDLKMVELAGWQHSEERNSDGFKIGYKSQDSELDTRSDYIPERNVSTLPTPTIDGEIVHVEKVYKDFLNWKAFRARGFTKFIELTLPQVLALRWDKKYNIDGIELILDKINFELPHFGTVKIEGFTG